MISKMTDLNLATKILRDEEDDLDEMPEIVDLNDKFI
jgi:hypothetical protein